MKSVRIRKPRNRLPSVQCETCIALQSMHRAEHALRNGNCETGISHIAFVIWLYGFVFCVFCYTKIIAILFAICIGKSRFPELFSLPCDAAALNCTASDPRASLPSDRIKHNHIY